MSDAYQRAIDWLFGRINYEQSDPIPYSDRGMKLDRMRELMERLGNPQDKLQIVHIAGTKGKGSTGRMIAEIMQSANYKVGTYSSPHLECFEERFQINGEPCSQTVLVDLIEEVRPIAEAMDRDDHERGGPTFFDLSTAIAFLYFKQQMVDLAVIEVGLGGRLDSTNVCNPMLSIITSISFDHMKQLGNTLSEIASEKAGIIKPNIPLISGVIETEPESTIQSIANEKGAPYYRLRDDFHICKEEDSWFYESSITDEGYKLGSIRFALPGKYQAENGAIALTAVEVLKPKGWEVSQEAMLVGLSKAKLPARLERFDTKPITVIDGAHNAASAQALAEALPELAPEAVTRTLLISMVEDKEASAVLDALLPSFDRVFVTQFLENPRARTPESLARIIAEHPNGKKLEISCHQTPEDAWCHAVRETDPSGVIVVAGSFFLAAEVRRLVVAQQSD